jgi:protein-S-isoprenylcysteine O-methyltransferase Ste14
MIGRVTGFLYGVACYLLFVVTFGYAIGFVGNIFVPKSIDSGRTILLGSALAIDFLLLGIFAVQHSVMARPWFKARWTRIIPATVERSTYVLFASLALLLLFWNWQPIGGMIWSVGSAPARLALEVLCVAGWVTVLVSTFYINHFDLFGLRQVWLLLTEKPYTTLRFGTPGPYKFVRHPVYVGFLIAFWATPVMTAAHLVFALATTAYIFTAIQFEEHDLSHSHTEYAKYREEVPMVFPVGSRKREETAISPQAAAKRAS